MLCIAVDAADNAQLAAEEIGQPRSFVRDLLREPFPDGVRLVVFCRSHRRDILEPPPHTLSVELKPFNQAETAAHLRHTFPDASENDVGEFHRLSSQNPRVQALALSRNLSLMETLRRLGPSPTTVESSIGTLLSDVIADLQDGAGPVERERVNKICAGLAVLRPRIPVPLLSKMSGVSEEAVRSFALDLGRPLLLSDDTVQFLDEPVETWFRDQFKPPPDELNSFILKLMPLAEDSTYAAAALPQLMLEAGQFSEVVRLALTSGALPDASEIEKRDVELQRLQFALKAALRLKRYVDATKLALKAGGETAGEDRQRNLIQANTDLAARFVDADVVQELVSRGAFGSGWVGSHHAYEAGLLSGRMGLIDDARSRLRMAFEWLNSWSRMPSEERDRERVEDADIAELAMAQLNIHGAVAAARFITGWQPREVAFRIGRIVASRLVDHGRIRELNDLATAAKNNLCLVLSIIIELRGTQQTPTREVVGRAFRLIAHSRVKLEFADHFDRKEEVLDAVTALVEAALWHSLCSHADAAKVLSRYLPETPPRGIASRFSGSRVCLLRAYCLRAGLEDRAVAAIDLAHTELRDELEKGQQYHSSREILEFRESVGRLLPWYRLWAATLLGKVAKEELKEELERTKKASAKDSHLGYSDDHGTQNEIALVWFEILSQCDSLDPDSLHLLTRWMSRPRRPLYTPTLIALARSAVRRDETKASGLEFAEEAFRLLRDERADAESKSMSYIEIARSILEVSPEEAATYFNEAVAVASRIGEENLDRWSAILYLADSAAQRGRPLPEVAYQFARCAELTYDYAVRDKYFDWTSTVKALSLLCPRSAVMILSRWRDRDFGHMERLLPITIHTLIENGSIDPHDALVFIGFEANWNYPKLLSAVLSKCKDHYAKQATCSAIFQYVKWQIQPSSIWNELSTIIKRHCLSVPDLDAYIAYTEEEERVDKRQQQAGWDDGTTTNLPDCDWDAVFYGCNLTTVAGVSRAHIAFRETTLVRNPEQFFVEAFHRVPVGRESTFIECVEACPEFNLYHFRYLIENLPGHWQRRHSVKHSLASIAKAFCRRFCMKISRSQYYEPLPFDLVCKLTGLEQATLTTVVLDAIGESPNMLDSNRLFSLVGLLKSNLTHEEALECFKYGLNLFEPALEDKDGDGPWSVDLSPPEFLQETLAGFVFAGLAAPSSKLRWEAAHVTLLLSKFGRDGVLRHLVDFADKKSCGSFVDRHLAFYRLHAIQWLLIALARAAEEVPAVLTPFADVFMKFALDDQPHVLIRQFAARAALALVDKGMVSVDDQVIRRLRNVNVTSLSVVESKSYERQKHDTNVETKAHDEDRFYFGIDIGPYWYEPLGKVFAISQKEVETKALAVIREEFDYTGKKTWRSDERGRRKLYDFRQTHATHGSYPDTDDLHFYLSYHAMMIVAGRLLLTKPTHRDTEWSDQEEFAEWLSRHDVSRADGRWLADRRDPAPLERPGWKGRETDDPEYRTVFSSDFDETLFAGELFTVWGNWRAFDSTRMQTVYVRSALVAPSRAPALLRALATSKDVHYYLIPSAGDELEIDRSEFVLKGWLENRDGPRGLDEKDHWAGGVRYPPPIPCDEVVELMSLNSDSDMRVWLDSEKKPVLSSQAWGHREVVGQDDHHENGERLRATLGFLKKLLSKMYMELVVEVQIERRGRNLGYGSRENDGERIARAAKIYLFRADGSITTL